jgi:GT2 family glycosyltransferase
MSAFPPVAIVILTYNSEAIIERCLNSFMKLGYPQAAFWLVDNASIDRTVSVVKDKFPQCEVLCAEVNDGYTGGNNLGIAAALSKNFEYILIVNPDTVLQNPAFVDDLVFQLEQQPRIGIAGTRVFLRSTECVQNTILFPPSLKRSLVHWFRYRWDRDFAHFSSNESRRAQMLNGVCVLLRSECLRQIGLFDESLFMYIEDADLAYRAKLMKWEIAYFPIDSVIHEQKEEGYNETSFVALLLKRNSAHYLMKISSSMDAVGYAAFSLGLFAVKFCLKSTQRASRLAYAAFVGRLGFEFCQVLMGKTLGRHYAQ